MQTKDDLFPYLGFGLGLRNEHFHDFIEQKPPVDWLEIMTEDYLIEGGKPWYYLEQIQAEYPLVMHGVSMSLGSTDELDKAYLTQVKKLAARIQPAWISDHLCFTGVNQLNMHDLLPLPYTEETVKHVARKIRQAQDFLERPMLIENVSSYLNYKDSQMTEWDFLNAVVEEADCYILLDINNIYVSSYNHHFDPLVYLESMPSERVVQFHLAGHTHYGHYIVDTHDHNVISEVWALYRTAIKQFGWVSTMIERDDNIPPLSELIQELNYAKTLAAPILLKAA